MSRQFITQGIILTRTDFAEADRIITFLTPDHGKLKAIAKAVRKSKSKLAGGIELFSVSDLTLVIGRGEIKTLISTRLVKHYGNIVKDIERTNAGYELLKLVNKATEEAAESGYFELLNKGLEALDNRGIEPPLTQLWFELQLLKLAGHMPNLREDTNGAKLDAGQTYNFDIERMRFIGRDGEGTYNTDQIKFLRLGFAAEGPRVLQRVKDAPALVESFQTLARAMLQNFIRI